MNRPDRLNAVTEELYEGLVRALADAAADAAVRVVLLRGAGRAFCVGADLKDHGVTERSEEEKRQLWGALSLELWHLQFIDR